MCQWQYIYYTKDIHFTSLPHFTWLHSTFRHFITTFQFPSFHLTWQGKVASACAGSWFQSLMVLFPPPPMAQQPLLGQGLIIIEASRSHRHTTLGRTPLEEWSARRRDLYLTTQTLTTDRHPSPGGIRTRNPSMRTAADPRPRPRGHWHRRWSYLQGNISRCPWFPILIFRSWSSLLR
jgi:hypothetical protein